MIAKEELTQIISRLENLEEEKASIAEGMAEVFADAKAKGYDVKALRQLLKLRKMDNDDRLQQEELLETYKAAIDMK